ncbi:meiosis expressed gene 1 protein homolog [Halichondria panicea]|uniref:meiosis expressed gene 1 protein homolog n=1 Tax=Halichondria panicea TaxID=6063 RepID=UPI00312B9051
MIVTYYSHSAVMSLPQPKKMQRAKFWSTKVEEAYRFQLAGYRDEQEYLTHTSKCEVDRWCMNNYVKKLVRKDGLFYYYNRSRECANKDLNKVKLYFY